MSVPSAIVRGRPSMSMVAPSVLLPVLTVGEDALCWKSRAAALANVAAALRLPPADETYAERPVRYAESRTLTEARRSPMMSVLAPLTIDELTLGEASTPLE